MSLVHAVGDLHDPVGIWRTLVAAAPDDGAGRPVHNGEAVRPKGPPRSTIGPRASPAKLPPGPAALIASTRATPPLAIGGSPEVLGLNLTVSHRRKSRRLTVRPISSRRPAPGHEFQVAYPPVRSTAVAGYPPAVLPSIHRALLQAASTAAFFAASVPLDMTRKTRERLVRSIPRPRPFIIQTSRGSHRRMPS